MAQNRSYIFNSKRTPIAFYAALCLIVLLEIFVFNESFRVADRSRVCLLYKNLLIKQHQNHDVLLLGWSRQLAIDARALEAVAPKHLSIYNHAVPYLGTTLHSYLILKKYLKHNTKPGLILASQPPESFCYPTNSHYGEILFFDPESPDWFGNQFRNYIGLPSLLRDVPYRQKYSFMLTYIKVLMPSLNYSFFLQKALREGDTAQRAERTDEILRNLVATNGQLLFNEDNTVDKDFHMPESPCEARFSNFENFIRLTHELDIPIVFFFMPVLDTRYQRMDELGWFSAIEHQMKLWENTYDNFHYTRMGHIVYNRQYFGDYSHLNRRGAHVYNREFVVQFKRILQTMPTPEAGKSRPVRELMEKEP